MRTPEYFVTSIEDGLCNGAPLPYIHDFIVRTVDAIQEDAMAAARSEADADWKPQVDRLTREVIILRGHIDRIYAEADDAKGF